MSLYLSNITFRLRQQLHHYRPTFLGSARSQSNAKNMDFETSFERSVESETSKILSKSKSMYPEAHMINKRSTGGHLLVNVSLLQYLDTGRWFMSVYNDDLQDHEVILTIEEAEGISTACPNDCSGHGSCYLGKCDCIDGFEGIDCSKSEYRPKYTCSYIKIYLPWQAKIQETYHVFILILFLISHWLHKYVILLIHSKLFSCNTR